MLEDLFPGPFFLNSDAEAVKRQYPILRQIPFKVLDSRGKKSEVPGGQLEFYHPDEERNPVPGTPTVEIFNENLKGPALHKAIFGDMLHYLPEVDQRVAAARDAYRKSITPEQAAIDQQAYKESGDPRPYEDWFNRSRLDAHLRGFLAPDAANEWAGSYTPEQQKILIDLLQYLQGPGVPLEHL